MKKLFTLLVVIGSFYSVQAQSKQAVVELFTNRYIAEYPQIVTILQDLKMDYIAYHSNSRDTLTNPDVMKRMIFLKEYEIPACYVNGYKLPWEYVLQSNRYDSLRQLTGDFTIHPSGDTKIVKFEYLTPPLNILTISIFVPDGEGSYITAVVTESFINGYQNVMRGLILMDTLYNGGELLKSVQFQPNWTVSQCQLTLLTTNGQHKINGFFQMPIHRLFTNVQDFPIVSELILYPNPTTDCLNIESNDPIGGLKIINMNGKTVFNQNIESIHYQIQVDKFPSGLYLVKTVTNTFRFIKQ